jgi:transposase-like protein
MKTTKHGLSEKEMELVQLLVEDCKTTGDIQAKLKKLFAGTIEQMLEAEMDEHLGYEKNSVFDMLYPNRNRQLSNSPFSKPLRTRHF